MNRPLPFRATALVLALAPLLAACDAVSDPPTSMVTAAERAERMQYLPEPTERLSQTGLSGPHASQASALARLAACPAAELHSARAALQEPCWKPPPPRDYALRFGGPAGSRFASSFHVIQDQTFRIALDIRPDHVSGTQDLLASTGGLRFSVLPHGALRFVAPGYVDGRLGTWALTTRPYAVRAGRWQRVEASFNELLLHIAVDGQVKASTSIYHDRVTGVIGPVTFAPSFAGSIDRPRFSAYDGSDVYEAATFDEGSGAYARFTGLSGRSHRLTRANWVPRSSTLAVSI